MGIEIEKRFLLVQRPPLSGLKPAKIIQGYLSRDPAKVIRIRQKDEEAFITIKGPRINGVSSEFEYPLPPSDATIMMKMCGTDILDKDRYLISGPDGMKWEVDLFKNRHEGLMIAELELENEDQPFEKPSWLIGYDVTNDNRFSNAALVDSSMEHLKQMVAGYTDMLTPRLNF